ncbi:MAG TPA: phosphoglycerate mutase family protein [Gemmatimonadales bacterium]|nr:phosphoglycerate mutase family protein [Gemmatimonadales bacterium]
MRRSFLLGLCLSLAGSPVAAQATTVILVRHAEKADTTADPALSEAGVSRARALAHGLARFPLAAIYVSEYRRTALTAQPVAAVLHLSPIAVPVGQDPHAQAQAIRTAVGLLPRGSAALVVGHSNTLPGIIQALGGPPIDNLCDAEYATMFVLELPGGGLPPRLLRTGYGPPNPPDAQGCLQRMQLE